MGLVKLHPGVGRPAVQRQRQGFQRLRGLCRIGERGRRARLTGAGCRRTVCTGTHGASPPNQVARTITCVGRSWGGRPFFVLRSHVRRRVNVDTTERVSKNLTVIRRSAPKPLLSKRGIQVAQTALRRIESKDAWNERDQVSCRCSASGGCRGLFERRGDRGTGADYRNAASARNLGQSAAICRLGFGGGGG